MAENKEHINANENIQSLKEALEASKNEKRSLNTKVSEVTKERDEALSRLRSSERLVYTLSFVICIVAVGFTIAFSTRQAKCHENLVHTKEEVKTAKKNTEQCIVDLSKCNRIIHDIEQEIKTNQDKLQQCNNKLKSKQETKTNQDKLKQCNDKLRGTETLLDQCKSKTCINEDAYDKINDKLEKCTIDLNTFINKSTKSKKLDKQQNKNDRKMKKCQSCLQDMESFNKQGVHILKDQVLQVIHVERPWRTAQKDCMERGGALVVPRNVDKLAEYLLEKEIDITNFWVGISDLEKASEFRGVNGGRVVGGWETQNEIYRSQNPSEKNPGNDCVRLTYTDPFSKGLVATHCEAMMYYICDMAANTEHDIYH